MLLGNAVAAKVTVVAQNVDAVGVVREKAALMVKLVKLTLDRTLFYIGCIVL